MGRIDYETETMVAHALRGEGFDASEDGTGRGTPLVPVEQPIPIDMRQASRGATMTNNRKEGTSGGAPGTGIGDAGDPAPSLSTSHVPAVAFDSKASQPQVGEDGATPTLRAMNHAGSHANAGGQLAVAFDLNQITSKTNRSQPDPAVHHTLPATTCPPHLAVAFGLTTEQTPKFNEDCALTLTKQSPTGGGQPQAVVTPWAVRRLTPTECHRLQGFPDGFCNIPWRGKDHAPDGPQYKALGNSMAVNVMSWIGRRIEMVEAITTSDHLEAAE